MTKIYQVVWTDGYGDHQEMGFYSTKEKAKKFINNKPNKDEFYIQEYEVH